MRRKKPLEGQLPLFCPQSNWKPPRLQDLPAWTNAKRIGIDIETYDPTIIKLGPGEHRKGRIIGVSFAIEDGPAFYLPCGHPEDNVDGDIFPYLLDQSKAFKGEVVGANLSYDLGYLFKAGITFPNSSWFRDIQIADPLIYELHLKYSLAALGERWGVGVKNEDALREASDAYNVHPKAGMSNLPARFVGEYATDDAVLPLKVYEKQRAKLDEEDLWNVFNLESRVLPALVRMRQRGIKIDTDQLTKIEAWAEDEENEALSIIKDKTGYSIGFDNIWKATAVAPALEAIGVKLGKTEKGAPQIDKATLESIDHVVSEKVAWIRKVNKLRTTFAQSIRVHMTNGRLHCGFNQLARDKGDGGIKGARYGRMSSEKPNIQQQPARDSFAEMWRSIYVPDTDDWAACDYSSQEPRMMAHYAILEKCQGWKKIRDAYHQDPDLDSHTLLTQMVHGEDIINSPDFKTKRSECKVVYLGLCYSMGGAKLCHSLGLPTEIKKVNERLMEVAGPEGREIIKQIDLGAPFVRQLSKRTEEVSSERGFIRTLANRRCRFPMDNLGNYDWTHKALNRLIQGSAADQTKMAMVACDRAGVPLQIQVHDELGLSVESREQAKYVGELMRNCIQLEIPTKVDVEVGPNWGKAKEMI